MMIDVITAKKEAPNPYQDIAKNRDSGRIVLDLEGNPKVAQQAPKPHPFSIAEKVPVQMNGLVKRGETESKTF